MLVCHAIHRHRFAALIHTRKSLWAFVIDTALNGGHADFAVANRPFGTIKVRAALDDGNTGVVQTDGIGRAGEVVVALDHRTGPIDASRWPVGGGALVVGSTTARGLACAVRAGVALVAIGVARAIARIDARVVHARLTVSAVVVGGTTGHTRAIHTRLTIGAVRVEGTGGDARTVTTQLGFGTVGAVETNVGRGAKSAHTLRSVFAVGIARTALGQARPPARLDQERGSDHEEKQ